MPKTRRLVLHPHRFRQAYRSLRVSPSLALNFSAVFYLAPSSMAMSLLIVGDDPVSRDPELTVEH